MNADVDFLNLFKKLTACEVKSRLSKNSSKFDYLSRDFHRKKRVPRLIFFQRTSLRKAFQLARRNRCSHRRWKPVSFYKKAQNTKHLLFFRNLAAKWNNFLMPAAAACREALHNFPSPILKWSLSSTHFRARVCTPQAIALFFA